MRKAFTLISAAFLLSFASYAQSTSLSTGYFTDGYIYKHRLNPALTPNMGYVSFPIINLGAGVQSSLSASDLFYPDASTGKLNTFLSPASTAVDAALMNNIKPMNSLNMNLESNVMSIGFFNNTGTMFSEISVVSRTNIYSNLPYDVFAFAKSSKPGQTYNMSNLEMDFNENIQVAFSQSYKIKEKFHVGYRVKFLLGAANAKMSFDNFNATLTADQWVVDAHGTIASSPLYFGTKKNAKGETVYDLSKIEHLSPSEIFGKIFRNFGFAGDLGFNYDPFEWLSASISFTDLGFMNYNDCVSGVSDHSGEKAIVYPDGSSTGVGTELKGLVEKLGTVAEFKPTENISYLEAMPTQMRIGVQGRIPSYQKFSIGLLYTQQFHKLFNWWELRASANYDVCRIFSFSLAYAYGTYGSQFGAILNLHMKGFNLFVGSDNIPFKWGSYKTESGSTIGIPVSTGTSTVSFGINFPFDTYFGRYPKEDK